ncbi:zinc-binding dehydrogenase [Nocardia sp. NPDC046763]|uniref:zinc-binding dehydrogenase n=1 Tax=Nocardia sp. NPDC046763 TaxID=3155256 RepID=UPI0033EABE61
MQPTLREFDCPVPDPGQLVIDCGYGGVCGTDLHLQQGHLAIPTPLVLGHEGLGTIAELGAGGHVDALGAPLTVGDRVMWASSISCGTCEPCLRYREPTLCERRRTYGVNRPVSEVVPLAGAWADRIVLHPGTTVVKVPAGIDDLAAMSFACAGPTMVHALFERRPVRVGETVVVQGSGPVGLAAAALAQLSGAALVVLAGGPSTRLEQAKRSGIGDLHVNVVDRDAESGLRDVRDLLPAGGADLVIECTGVPAAIQQGIGLARRGGSYLIVGQYTDAGTTVINPHHIVRQQLDVIGSWAFSGAHLLEYVRLLPALATRFDLAGLVTSFPLAQYPDAMAAVREGRVIKAVLAADSMTK